MASKLNQLERNSISETQYTNKIILHCSALVHDLLKMPVRNMWIDYDEQADVLYISFRKPQRATRTIEHSSDILIRKSGRKIVGVTIMNASTHA